MRSVKEILAMTPGNPIPTCDSSAKTTDNSYGVHFVGYNLAPEIKEYQCPLCQDNEILQTGIDEYDQPIFKVCPCKANKEAARKIKSSGLSEKQLNYKLEDYRVTDGNRKMFDGIKKYLQVWPELINNPAESKGFYLTGNPGIGKTMLSCIVARNMLEAGISVVFVSAAELMAELRTALINKEQESMESKIDVLAKAQAMILDDLGKDKPSKWIQSMYYRIIDLRYRKNLLTCFNANCLPGDLAEWLGDYGPATVSRIIGMTRNYVLHAKDIDHRISGG